MYLLVCALVFSFYFTFGHKMKWLRIESMPGVFVFVFFVFLVEFVFVLVSVIVFSIDFAFVTRRSGYLLSRCLGSTESWPHPTGEIRLLCPPLFHLPEQFSPKKNCPDQIDSNLARARCKPLAKAISKKHQPLEEKKQTRKPPNREVETVVDSIGGQRALWRDS